MFRAPSIENTLELKIHIWPVAFVVTRNNVQFNWYHVIFCFLCLLFFLRSVNSHANKHVTLEVCIWHYFKNYPQQGLFYKYFLVHKSICSNQASTSFRGVIQIYLICFENLLIRKILFSAQYVTGVRAVLYFGTSPKINKSLDKAHSDGCQLSSCTSMLLQFFTNAITEIKPPLYHEMINPAKLLTANCFQGKC